jgi:hypothetical protein
MPIVLDTPARPLSTQPPHSPFHSPAFTAGIMPYNGSPFYSTPGTSSGRQLPLLSSVPSVHAHLSINIPNSSTADAHGLSRS